MALQGETFINLLTLETLITLQTKLVTILTRKVSLLHKHICKEQCFDCSLFTYHASWEDPAATTAQVLRRKKSDMGYFHFYLRRSSCCWRPVTAAWSPLAGRGWSWWSSGCSPLHPPPPFHPDPESSPSSRLSPQWPWREKERESVR